jgi:hypothetical protein
VVASRVDALKAALVKAEYGVTVSLPIR